MTSLVLLSSYSLVSSTNQMFKIDTNSSFDVLLTSVCEPYFVKYLLSSNISCENDPGILCPFNLQLLQNTCCNTYNKHVGLIVVYMYII